MIRVERDGGLTLLWLARADKANALTGTMLESIAAAVASAAETGSKALVIWPRTGL